jgi:hypothetical protein
MNQVYRNSTINFSASGAQEASQGFSFDRDPYMISPLPPCPIFRNFDLRQHGSSQPHHAWRIVHTGFWKQMFGNCPVFRRAWIFQERFLSSRTLHFGREQVFWKCRTQNCCETFPEGYPTRSQPPRSLTLKFMYEQLQSLWPNQIPTNKRFVGFADRAATAQMQMAWEALVGEYTKGRLTKSSDKLIAFSGMANDFWATWVRKIDGHPRYLAGLWSSHLPQALLWITSSTASRPAYRAPSWSWASIQGKIDWNQALWTHPYTSTVTIIDINVAYVDKEWGQVKDGHVEIRGPLIQLCWSTHSDHYTFMEPDGIGNA